MADEKKKETITWENESNRAVSVRGVRVEPGEAIDIDDPSPSEKLMYGEKDDAPSVRKSTKNRKSGRAAKPENTAGATPE